MVGGAAGVTGARLSTGIAQQARPQHIPRPDLQHLWAAGGAVVAPPVGIAKTLCQTVTMLTKTASSAVPVLLIRVEIELVTSFVSLPYFRLTLAAGLLFKVSIPEFSATAHGLSHVGIFVRRADLQSACLDHRAICLTVCAFASFIIGRID
jgi:hypothetical protein